MIILALCAITITVAVIYRLTRNRKAEDTEAVPLHSEIFFLDRFSARHTDYLLAHKEEIRGLAVESGVMQESPERRKKIQELVRYILLARFRPVFIYMNTMPGMWLPQEYVSEIIGSDIPLKCDLGFTMTVIFPTTLGDDPATQYPTFCGNENYDSRSAAIKGITRAWPLLKTDLKKRGYRIAE